MRSRKVVFLDRDGTLIIDKHYLRDPSLITYLPTTFAALSLLHEQGFEFVIVTNQSGVAKGLITLDELEAIHLKMRQDFSDHKVPLLHIAYCAADSDSEDPRRKPQPGMILESLKEYNISPEHSWMIGDKKADVDAGLRAKVRPVFLSTGKEPPPPGIPYYKTLMDAAVHILKVDHISN